LSAWAKDAVKNVDDQTLNAAATRAKDNLNKHELGVAAWCRNNTGMAFPLYASIVLK